MTLHIQTARVSYVGADRFDITRKSGGTEGSNAAQQDVAPRSFTVKSVGVMFHATAYVSGASYASGGGSTIPEALAWLAWRVDADAPKPLEVEP